MNPAHEPSPTEVYRTLALGALAFPFYRAYIHRLPLAGNERVLDFGAGAGVCTRHLAARLKRGGGRVTCVNISPRWHEVIQKNLSGFSNIDYHLGDIEALNLPNRTYDAILIHLVLHTIPPVERPRILAALAHKLKPGGLWFVREPVERAEITPEAIHDLLCGLGFTESSRAFSRHRLTGRLYEAVFQ